MKLMHGMPSSDPLTAPLVKPPTLAEFRAEYKKADDFCSEVQTIHNAAGEPAINELRNAGQHLLAALSNDLKSLDGANMISALNHARRACYEASEAGIIFCIEIINKFQDDYREIVITDVVGDYVNHMTSADNAIKMLQSGRQENFNRDQDHSDRMDAFRDLAKICQILTVGRNELNKIVARKRSEANRWVLGIIVAIVGGLLTVPSTLDWLDAHDIINFFPSVPPKSN
jgi:hypothetical protein